MIRSRIWKKKNPWGHYIFPDGILHLYAEWTSYLMFSKYKELHVPRGAEDNNLPANEGNMDSIPLPGGCQKPQSNYAPVLQLLTHALLEPMLCNKRSPHSEEPEHHNEE